jgi:probable HAF family extracellular repeat protein
MSCSRFLILHAVFGVAAALSTSSAVAASRYHVTDLGVANTPISSGVTAMNDFGFAVGEQVMDDRLRCVVFEYGRVVRLPSASNESCTVNDINDAGIVVGASALVGDTSTLHAFSYQYGTKTDLGTYPGYPFSEAIAINNRNQIVGNSSNGETNRVFVYFNGLFKQIPMSPGAVNIYASAINDRGDVTGTAQDPHDDVHAFLYSAGVSRDLGTLANNVPNSQSEGLAVNLKGDVAGWSSGVGFFQHATLFTKGRVIDLGTVPASPFASSTASGINDRGWVVGVSDPGTGDDTVAFLYDSRQTVALETLLDARSAGWKLLFADSINALGQIAGMGRSPADGQLHIFLATPTF